MIRGFWTARTGLNAHQTRLDTVANNLANVSTHGFKPMRTSFKDLMYQNLNRPAAQDSAMTGSGVKVNSNDLLMANGALTPTGHETDMALLREGDFFAVDAGDDTVLYTRAGNFYMQLEDGGGTAWLVDASGRCVLDADGNHIELEYEQITRILYGANGEPLRDANGNFLRETHPGTGFVFDPATVGVYRFPNAYGLDNVGANSYIATAHSGEPEPVENPEYMQYYLESSGVNIATEMVSMIEAQRAFSLSSRVLQTADEVEQTVNSLR